MTTRAITIVTILFLARAASAAEVYFPDLSLAEKAEDHEKRQDYYRAVFKAFDEPSFLTLIESGKASESPVFRFTWLRTFHRPVCIVFTADEKSPKLNLKVLDGQAGYTNKLGKLVTEKTFNLRREDLTEFKRLLDEADYDDMQSIVDLGHAGAWLWDERDHRWLRSYSAAKDGSSWLLERSHGKSYWFVERHNALKTSFGKACLHLLKSAGYDDGEGY